MSVYLHALAILLPEKKRLLPMKKEAEWAQNRSEIFGEETNLFALPGIETSTPKENSAYLKYQPHDLSWKH